MQDDTLQSAILACVNNPYYKPAKPKVIARNLGLLGESGDEVRILIKKMVRKGLLTYGPNHLVLPVADGEDESADVPQTSDEEQPAAEASQAANSSEPVLTDADEDWGEITDDDADWPAPAPQEPNSREKKERKTKKRQERKERHLSGTFRRASKGYGFVRPQGTSPQEGKDGDIYISEKDAGDAASGDIVRVRLSQKRGRMGKVQGRIIDVIERATSQFVGRYFEDADMGWVDIDGRIFSQPVYVGDPGAKGAVTDDKVVIEMVRFPSHVREGEAVITRVLGQRGQPEIDTMSIIYEFGLPEEFPDDVREDSRKQAIEFDESIPDDRKDLTGKTTITIDPVDARDFDDAISLEPIDNDHWLLGVHIADVSHFVRPKTPLDREAYNRATSIYLPDRVIPMLPEVVSNNLASLQPDKVRYTMSAMIEMTAEGIPVAVDVFKSAIRSDRRFTYEEVDEFLADRNGWREKLSPEIHTLLGNMHTLAMRLRSRRLEFGALELSMPEVKVDLDKSGRVTGAHVEVNSESHQIIEEFMLAANIGVAEKLTAAGLAFLRRVHGEPSPRKLKMLTQFVQELDLEVDDLQSRFALQDLLKQVEDDPRRHAVNYAVLRAMQRAVYSPEEEAHFALASDNYCHFTSPIRRYPDLTIHRLLDALARGKKPTDSFEAILGLGDHCSEREQRATEAERELTKVKLLNYLKDKVGMKMEGIITGVESFGIFATGIELPAEGFIHITALSDDYYRFDRAGHVIRGYRSGNEFRLGDRVDVAVAVVDVDRRELDFRLVGHDDRSGASSGAQREKQRRGQSRNRPPGQRGESGKKKGKSKGKPGKKPRRKR